MGLTSTEAEAADKQTSGFGMWPNASRCIAESRPKLALEPRWSSGFASVVSHLGCSDVYI